MAKGDTIMLHNGKGHNNISNYRPITLLNHTLKVLTKILNNRIIPVYRDTLHESQMGFREELGCRDALFTKQEATDEILRHYKGYSILLVDFRKAFNTLQKN